MLKPLHDHVVLEAEDKENKTKSGIILSSKDKERPNTAKVVAVGDGSNDQPLTVKVGDTVLFKSYAPTEFTHQEKPYLILKESDILAIVEGD